MYLQFMQKTTIQFEIVINYQRCPESQRGDPMSPPPQTHQNPKKLFANGIGAETCLEFEINVEKNNKNKKPPFW